MKKITYRFIPIPQRLYESMMYYEHPHAVKLGMIIAKMMFCHYLTSVTLDIYEIKAFGIPEKMVMDTIEKIRNIGWFEVEIAADYTRASFKKPRIIQSYNDHLNPIISELVEDAIKRNTSNTIKEKEN